MTVAGFFENIEIGTTADLGSYLFTAENIRAFAQQYDPQRFHIDEQAGRDSHFGGMIASGWHTVMGFVHCWSSASRDSEAEMGMVDAIDELLWPRPVFPGDEISYAVTVEKKSPSNADKHWGIVDLQVLGRNQNDETVLEMLVKLPMEKQHP